MATVALNAAAAAWDGGGYPGAGDPPDQALDWWKRKKLEPGFSYLDVWKDEHAYAFTVAKVTEQDILADVQTSLKEAMANGETMQSWRERVLPLFEKSGWASYVKEEQRPRRLKLIYDTNMRTARAAGHWQRIQRNKATHPFLMYQLGPSREHREEHASWSGTILPADDPFWSTHYPPNGWGCKCWVRALSKSAAARYGGESPRPDTSTEPWVNKKTGETELVPKGIDPGWNYNAGLKRDEPLRTAPMGWWGPRSNAPPPENRAHEAEAEAIKKGLSKVAGYRGFSPENARTFNTALEDATRSVPEIVGEFDFVGSIPARNEHFKKVTINQLVADGLSQNYAEHITWLKMRKMKMFAPDAAQWIPDPIARGIAITPILMASEASLDILIDGVHQKEIPPECGTIAGVVNHEVGHFLDQRYGLSKRQDFRSEWESYRHGRGVDNHSFAVLSIRAGLSISEFIATAWAEFTTSTHPRPLAQKIGHLIQRVRREGK
jgi:hypothetical protein